MTSAQGQGVAPDAAPVQIWFCLDDLRRVRMETADWASRMGLRAERAVDFVIAVSEIATNAVRYGSPRATLQLRADGRNALLAEVRDAGLWESEVGPVDAEGRGRMGLALARRVCDGVDIRAGLSGTTVTLRMNLAG